MKKLEYRECMACSQIKKVDIYSEAIKLQLCHDCYEEIEKDLK